MLFWLRFGGLGRVQALRSRRECDGYSSTIAAWLRREGETLYFHGIVRFGSGKYRRIEML